VGGVTASASDPASGDDEFHAVELASHEFSANFLFDEHGLTPFFAADRRVISGGGSQQATFQVEGERWQVSLWHTDSGLVHPGSHLPTGTAWYPDEMREFRLSVERQ
jgi:hypothetical protein